VSHDRPKQRAENGWALHPGKPKGARHEATLAAEVVLDGEAEALSGKVVEMDGRPGSRNGPPARDFRLAEALKIRREARKCTSAKSSSAPNCHRTVRVPGYAGIGVGEAPLHRNSQTSSILDPSIVLQRALSGRSAR
jgi:hypothetical protein